MQNQEARSRAPQPALVPCLVWKSMVLTGVRLVPQWPLHWDPSSNLFSPSVESGCAETGTAEITHLKFLQMAYFKKAFICF